MNDEKAETIRRGFQNVLENHIDFLGEDQDPYTKGKIIDVLEIAMKDVHNDQLKRMNVISWKHGPYTYLTDGSIQNRYGTVIAKVPAIGTVAVKLENAKAICEILNAEYNNRVK